MFVCFADLEEVWLVVVEGRMVTSTIDGDEGGSEDCSKWAEVLVFSTC